MSDIMKTILNVFRSMGPLAVALVSLVVILVIGAVLLGVFQTQATSTLSLPGNVTAFISTQVTEFTTLVAVFWDALTSTTGFIVIGVIIAIAVAFLGRKIFGGSMGGKY